MTTQEHQVKNTFIYILQVIVLNVVPLVTLPIFTRILSKEDFGALALAQVYAVFVSGLANFGLPISYDRNFFQYRERGKASELLYSILLFVVCAFLFFCLITYLFKFSLSKWIIGSSAHANLLFFVFLSTCIIGLESYFLTYFRNSENAKSFAWYTVNQAILAFVLSVFMVAYLEKGIIGLVLGQLLAALVFLSVLTIKFLHFLPASFNWPILKDCLKLSYPLTPRVFLKTIGSQFDKYMIGLLASVGGVGIYSIGQKVANLIFVSMTAMGNVFVPQVYRRMFDMGDKGGVAVGRYLTPFAYISIAFALIISLFSEEVISILTPKSYHGAIDIVIILSIFYGALFFGKQPQLIFAKKSHIILLLTIVSIGLTVSLNIPFIIRWGAIGAAWATLLAGLISGAISFVLSQHYYKIEWEYKKIGAIFFIFFISSVLMILLRQSMVDYDIRFLIKTLFIGGYLLLGIKLNIITKGNYILVKDVFLLKVCPSFRRL